MGNCLSKARTRSSKGQFGDLSDDRAKENKLSLVGHTSNYGSALSPYSTSAALAMPLPPHNDAKAVSSPFPTRAEYLRQPLRAESLQDALQTLRNYDTTIIMDDSSSMTGSLWNEAEQALATLVDVASQYDASAAGIDIQFLNCNATMKGVTDSRVVHEQFAKFQPCGPTTVGNRLSMILGDYFGDLYAAKGREDGCKNIKPLNVLIITDGASSDDVESVIVYFARLLEADKWPLGQVGIQFVQIGDSRHAARFLRQLDDLKQAHIRDIVDTTPYIGQLHADMLIKVLVGGINRRVDTTGGDSVMF
ncbi:uncharacterized protein EDB91DRAFT_1081001 [Suillus paluster]|uniref:uncharacterized protein n=1 Tax=Suillus paluster TaxID=48578 RepID=UPI001B883F7C|nr:uncharacterized protein EDB91DRAFT_1081001 [Suillus paluster]KAG1743605.1 hypothetical protein EDB91DRAFT_1081001 [Suillus paluster]